MRVFAGCRDIDASDPPAAAFDQRLDIARDLLDVRLVQTVITYENIQLIEIRFFSKLDQGGEIDVAVNDVLQDRKSTRLNSSHGYISYAVFCLKKKNNQ